MAGTATVTVTYGKDGIKVEPMEVRLAWEKGNDTVNWIVENCPKELNVKIAWNLMSPFWLVEEIDKGKRVIGRVNSQDEGEYGYSVLFIDGEGQVVAGIDPVIINHPHE